MQVPLGETHLARLLDECERIQIATEQSKSGGVMLENDM